MSIYVKRSCPKCGTTIEGYTRDYRAIGQPFVQCNNCKTIIKLSHVTEWELLSLVGKLKYLAINCWTNFLFGMALPVVALFYDKYSDFYEMNDSLLIKLIIIGFSVVTLGRGFLFVKSIKQSKTRMKNQNYRKLLKELGIFYDADDKIRMKYFFKDKIEFFDFLIISSLVVAVFILFLNLYLSYLSKH